MTSFKTQDMDVFADDDPGINFDADDQTWTVSPGVLVSSGQQSAVFSSFGHSVLFNEGTLFSGGAFEAGVFFSGDAGLVSNAAGATIIGAEDGIFADGRTPEVNNLGTILESAATVSSSRRNWRLSSKTAARFRVEASAFWLALWTARRSATPA